MTERVDDGADPVSGSMIVNPRAPKPTTVVKEGTGVVTSDSLAAESLARGGDFAEGRAVADPVPSKSTTTNTTDTSGATTLAPAPDAPSRNVGLEDYAPRTNNPEAGAYDTTKGGPQAADAGAAPTYVAAVTGEASFAGEKQPKGKNLTEGGFDPNAPNASFKYDADSSKAPGREGLLAAQKGSATIGEDAGYPNASAGADAGGPTRGYGNLDEETSA